MTCPHSPVTPKENCFRTECGHVNYHLHVTPRFKGDWFYNDIYHKVKMPMKERAEHAARVRDCFEKAAR